MPPAETDFFEDTFQHVFDPLFNVPEFQKSNVHVERQVLADDAAPFLLTPVLTDDKDDEMGYTSFNIRVESSNEIVCTPDRNGARRLETELIASLRSGSFDYFDNVEDCFIEESDDALGAVSARALTTDIAKVDIILMGLSHTLSSDLEYTVADNFDIAYNSVYNEGQQHLNMIEVSDQHIHAAPNNRKLMKKNLRTHRNLSGYYGGDYLVLETFVERESLEQRRALTTTSEDELLLLHRWFELYFCDLMKSLLNMELIDCLILEPR